MSADLKRHEHWPERDEWPSHEAVGTLVERGGLSGAELDVLNEYLSQPLSAWAREIELEACTDYMLPNEMSEQDICSLAEAQKAEKGFAGQLISRVQMIFQLHAFDLLPQHNLTTGAMYEK